MPRRPVALIATLLALVGVLAGCRVDVEVALTIGPDGTGELVVSATADAEVVEQAPGLADDLRFEDAVAAGWVVDGPTATTDGGLVVVLRHPVTSAGDATNLLASLGPPFDAVTLERSTVDDETTTTLSGRLELTAGFDSFADADLLAAVGATPFAAEIAAAGATPADALSIVLRADLPGEVDETTGDSTGGALRWDAPLDGSSRELTTRTSQRPASGGSWAGPLSALALVLLVAWVLVSITAIVLVVRARQRRGRRRAPSRLR